MAGRVIFFGSHRPRRAAADEEAMPRRHGAAGREHRHARAVRRFAGERSGCRHAHHRLAARPGRGRGKLGRAGSPLFAQLVPLRRRASAALSLYLGKYRRNQAAAAGHIGRGAARPLALAKNMLADYAAGAMRLGRGRRRARRPMAVNPLKRSYGMLAGRRRQGELHGRGPPATDIGMLADSA